MARDNRPDRRTARPVKGRAARRSGLPAVAWIGLGGLVLVLVGLLLSRQTFGSTGTAAPAGSRVAGKPSLAVDRDSIDFGRVPLDKPVTATFKLTNLGDKPLTLAGKPTVEVVKGC